MVTDYRCCLKTLLTNTILVDYVLLIYTCRISKGQEINSGIQSTLGKSVDYCCEKNVEQSDSNQTFQYI